MKPPDRSRPTHGATQRGTQPATDRWRRGSMRADALAVYDAIVAAGASVTPGRKAALNTFFAAKAAGSWGTKVARLHVWNWALDTANAIDLITLGSGTFTAGGTHNATGVTGNGSSTKFTFHGGNIGSILTSINDCGFGFSAPSNFVTSKGIMGRYQSSAMTFGIETGGTNTFLYTGIVTPAGGVAVVNKNGIFLVSRTSTVLAELHQLRAGAFTTLATGTDSNAGGAFPAGTCEVMNTAGSGGFMSTPLNATFLLANGTSQAESEAFMRALQALLDS